MTLFSNILDPPNIKSGEHHRFSGSGTVSRSIETLTRMSVFIF